MRKRGQVCDKRSQARCTIPESRNGEDEVDPTRFFCVGCMESHDIDEGNRHHVLEHAEGGLSERWNVLMLCGSCHAVFHNGTKKDRDRVFMRTFAYMTARYGVLFVWQYKEQHEVFKTALTKEPMTLTQIRHENGLLKRRMDMELAHLISPGVVKFWLSAEPYKSVFNIE